MNIQQGRWQQDRWHPLSKGLHWLFVLLLIGVWAAVEIKGFYGRGEPMRGWWMGMHFSLGTAVLVLMVLRLYWRVRHRRPRALGARWQQYLSRLTHSVLYAVLLAMPLSGIAMRQSYGRDTEFFGLFKLPRVLAENPDLGSQLAFLHKEVLWPALLVLIAVHIAAALWHHFIARDTTLRRMLPLR